MPVPAILTITLNPAIDLELEVAEFRQEGVMTSTHARRSAGGKGLNVARVLATLGVPTTAGGAIGGADSRVFMELLQGAPFEFVALGQNKSEAAGGDIKGVRTNVTLSAQGRTVCKVNQPGAALSPKVWGSIRQHATALMKGRKWVVLAGSLPLGAKSESYLQLAHAARHAGAHVAIDCTGEPLIAAIAARPELVKINAAELLKTAQEVGASAGRGWRAIDSAIEALLRAGACNVIVTDGQKQIIAAGKLFAPRIACLPPCTEARGKVGGGDAFLAGFLAALLKQKRPAEALRWGAAAGAATIALPDPIFPTGKQIHAALKKIAL